MPISVDRFGAQGEKRLGSDDLPDIVMQDVAIVYVDYICEDTKVRTDIRGDPGIAQFLERFFQGAKNDDVSLRSKSVMEVWC